MYLLPNKNKIDDNGIREAMKDENPNTHYFLDTITGNVCVLEKREDKSKLEKLLGDTRYISIPRISNKDWFNLLKDFAKMIGEMDGEISAKLIIKELEKREVDILRRCLAVLEKTKDGDGWIYGWAQFESDSICEKMTDWFCTLPIDIEDDWQSELDCDCELCKLFVKGNHTIGDFNEAKQKEENKKKYDK